MNKEYIRILEETYNLQKPVYVSSHNAIFHNRQCKDVLSSVMVNNQKCCANIWKLLCEEFKKDPVCSEDKFFTISSKVYFPWITNSNGVMVCDKGAFLEKIDGQEVYYPIGLYCEIVNGKELYYPIMHHLVSQQLGYYGIIVREGLNDFNGVPLKISINSITLAQYLKLAGTGKIEANEENRVLSLTIKSRRRH